MFQTKWQEFILQKSAKAKPSSMSKSAAIEKLLPINKQQ